VTPYLEIGGDYRELVPGVHLIELPLPFSLGLVNVYLIRLCEGWLLVDCGMDTDACFHAFERAREGLDLKWTDIRRILLTHMHPDHTGLASRLRALSGAPLGLHKDENRLLEQVCQAESHRAWQSRVLAEAGVGPALRALIDTAMLDIQQSFHVLAPVELLAGGEQIPTKHGTLEVLVTPGHSPGHICLYDRARRLLFSGDHVLEHISPNIGWHPERDALGDFLASLDLVAALEVDLVLPSHGTPFTGHREWIARTHSHHRARCDRILGFLQGGTRTADDLVRNLWGGDLSPFHYRFAVFEVLAHLTHLEKLGEVGSITEDGVCRWTG
jgi:glyoxylase-like metal-dependent hydrolase (beta-lactamase superfamily II)